ncbi:MAG: glutathione peroxidase [Burkholderiales bacterium]
MSRDFGRQIIVVRLVAIALSVVGFVSASAADDRACSPLLNHHLTSLQGKPQRLCDYQGKVLLIVNTASFCGFTSQYKGLEALYQKYKDRGLVVLGFPSNDFGQQEPGNSKEIAAFCERTYQVRFPMFEKSAVTGPEANPVFQQLAAISNDVPKWNFHKYLVSRSGTKVVSFSSSVTPEDARLTAQIESMLGDRASRSFPKAL